MTKEDRDLLVRIDERVGVIQREIKIYRRELENMKKRVYTICGGLAVVQFFGPLISKLFLSSHSH